MKYPLRLFGRFYVLGSQ
uniref:Uncharacterized protein n=1 Tax=Rhizophora mucronata TaxID=61149 RepID=A0A2P2LM97_RHIMU